MKTYRVELRGECRELIYIDADSPEDAELNWAQGQSDLLETMGMDVYSVTEEDA